MINKNSVYFFVSFILGHKYDEGNALLVVNFSHRKNVRIWGNIDVGDGFGPFGHEHRKLPAVSAG